MKRLSAYLLIVATIIALTISQIPTPTIYKDNYIEIYDKDNNLITSEIKNKTAQYIPLTTLNEYTINAFIAYEDKDFYHHHGFDFFAIIRAFFRNLFSFSFSQGASTITQQYARTLFLNNKKSITRKLKEAYYTIKIEKRYTKKQIIEGYLNSIYLGHGCYGIDAASKYYFNKSSSQLTIGESALLASLPSSPSNSSPFINYNKSLNRRNLVLKAMLKQKYITESQYKEEINNELSLNKDSLSKTNLEYYLDKVKDEVKKMNLNPLKGLKVYTNIDSSLYKIISPLINKYYSNNNQLSLIILENKSNKVLVSIGGYNYTESSFNRGLYSKRQVGSTIKTFLYSFALENNFDLNTKLHSAKTEFNIKDYGTYSPSNSNDIYANRPITMKEAYAVSDNIYAIKTLLLLGSDNFIEYLKRFNLIETESVPSIALGSSSFTLYELLKAYSVYPNDGYYYNYSFINKIEDQLGNTLYNSSMNKKLVLHKSTVDKTKQLMSLPFYNDNYYTKATLENYNIDGYYGKSGSTNADSYLILFNDKYTLGIWIGNDQNNELNDYTTTKYLLKEISSKI